MPNVSKRLLVFFLLLSLFIIFCGMGWQKTASHPIHHRIVTTSNEKLRQSCSTIYPDDLTTLHLLQEMADYIKSSTPPVFGLALPQIGIPKRGFVVRINNKPLIMINPTVYFYGNQEPSYESCLSIPRTAGFVYRSNQISVIYYDLRWQQQQLFLQQVDAYIVQHEYDHLNGVLFTDKLIPKSQLEAY